MGRVRTGVVIGLVATGTGIRGIDVVAVVASVAVGCNRDMRSCEWVNGIVVKRGRRPGTFTMAAFAIGRKLVGGVIGVGRCNIIGLVTACTGVGRIGVIAVVARRTVIGDGGMSPVERVIIMVNGKSSRRPARGRGMARCAIV